MTKEDIDENLRYLVDGMLEYDVQRRINVREAIEMIKDCI